MGLEHNVNKPRLIIMGFILISSLTVYGVFIFNLQVINYLQYQDKAEKVSSRISPIPAQRGEIYDRNGDTPLVINIDYFALNIIPGEVSAEEIDGIITSLAEILGVSSESIWNKIPPNYQNIFSPVEIMSEVSFDTIKIISEHIDDFPGITWNNKPIRRYIDVESLSHIIGYVGDISQEQFQVLYNKGYSRNDTIGKSGVEQYYDDILRGTSGTSFRTVDVKGRSIADSAVEDIPPVPGNHIVLTLDRDLQKLCEKALGPRMGSIVVMKPATGEILAMVSYPWYDPNIFSGNTDSEEYNRLRIDHRYPFINRAVQSSYAPASTFKMIMTTAILEENAIDPQQTINCEGKIYFGDRYFHCHIRTGHGQLNLGEALAESCDIYFYTAGLKHLGVETINNYCIEFGLGSKTGIDLPNEISGLVPNPQWKEQTLNTAWKGGDTVNMSIGQGYLQTTPIQLANMISFIVNEGTIYRPHVLKDILDPVTGKSIYTEVPEILKNTDISKETFSTVQQYLRGVITDGTARVVINTDAVEIAGKTGTGEVGLSDSWDAWFVAYAPYETNDPEERIVVVTMVEAANEWEWWAIRAAHIVFHSYFTNLDFDETVADLGYQWLFLDEDAE